MQKAYYYPSASRFGYSNPYSQHFKKNLSSLYYVCDSKNKPSRMLTLSFLKYSLIADIFFINWLESAPFLRFGKIQFFLAISALFIIKVRKKKIIWMLHNIHPHSGKSRMSDCIQRKLFRDSALVISHSREAWEFAKEHTKGKCLFFHHPVLANNLDIITNEIRKYDVLIWGSIFPYKGIYEFLSNKIVKQSRMKILIIGTCSDEKLIEKIESCCSEGIVFENRRADFDEIFQLVKSSRFVLFPYVGNCVSSSGALMDTLVLGGNPIGPNVGAFDDLKKLGLCLTYKDYDDLMVLLHSNWEPPLEAKNEFFKENSWEKFVNNLYENI